MEHARSIYASEHADSTQDSTSNSLPHFSREGGGYSHMKQTGMLVGNFEFRLKTNLGVTQAFCVS